MIRVGFVDQFKDIEFYEILKELYIDIDYYKTSLRDFLTRVDRICQKFFHLKAGFFIQTDQQGQTHYIPFGAGYQPWEERVRTLYSFKNQTSSYMAQNILGDDLPHAPFCFPDEDQVIINSQFISFIYGFFPICDATSQKKGMLFFACEKETGSHYTFKVENHWRDLYYISKIFNKFLIFKLQAEHGQNIKKAFLKALEAKDIYSYMHADFVTKYVRFISQKALQENDANFQEEDVDNLILAAELHDIGKINIPDGILNKPGKITEEEYREIKRHPFYAYKLLDMVNVSPEVLRLITNHHERCDGMGYYRKSRREMDLALSILILADCFDAMTSWRYYKPKEKILSLTDALHEFKCQNSASDGGSHAPRIILPRAIELLEKCLEDNLENWEKESQERNSSLEELARNWNKTFREIPLYCQHFPEKKCMSREPLEN
jgi:HD-GYP domain-containing protein (c-di-GMP phosphodiesterase class II)